MSNVRDTLFRYLTLLQLIPRSPGRIATPVLLEKLRERGFRVDTRSLQRDLRDKLALHFPLICDDTQKPFRWYFDRQFQSNLPALDLPSALTLVLAEENLKGILPPVVLGQLAPQFAEAHRLLDDLEENGLSQWRRRVRAIPNGKALLPASIEASIWQCVTQALLENKAIEVRYLSRSREDYKTLTLHPQGLVSRHSVTYIVATVDKYSDLRQFALHRINQATISQMAWHEVPGFDLIRISPTALSVIVSRTMTSTFLPMSHPKSPGCSPKRHYRMSKPSSPCHIVIGSGSASNCLTISKHSGG